jgi:F-type H+-transporting ATPase subunit b
MELLMPAVGLLFWMALVFGILVIGLKMYAWKPIIGGLKEREDQIQSALDLAERTRAEMQKLQADNQQLLVQARTERDSILKAAKEASDNMITEAKNKAQAEGKRLIEDAREAINNERVAVMAQMKKEVVTLSLGIAEKVLRKELTDKTSQQKLIAELAETARLN